jgi:hypothetical protein
MLIHRGVRRLRTFAVVITAGALCGALAGVARADGATEYLPLHLDPVMERQVERVLILADEPILKRPFAVGLVEDALPEACRVDEPLCLRVQRYLRRYSRDYALTEASVTGTYAHGGRSGVVPNQHGLPLDANWEVSAQGFIQPSDYWLVSGGVESYQGRTTPEGTMLSFGFHGAQVDIGYRDHDFSPMTDSSQLIGTEAPTTPSITISNWQPITRLGFQYELFLTQLSRTPILYRGRLGSGNPRLFGMQLSIEPFPGWSLGFNRLLQYGGGDGLPSSASTLLRNVFKPTGAAQLQGNQQASYVSRFIYPGRIPFAIYFQYAGEDNSDGGSYLLGNAALSAGIDFPRLGRHFDATFETSEWQNLWYVHNIFLNGMTSDGLVLGNWGADQRVFGDGVGARSFMLRVGWTPPFGGYLEERVRTLVNQDYYGGDSRVYTGTPPYPYHRYYDEMLRYSRPWRGFTVGGEALVGRDVFGKSFARISGFVRYGGDTHGGDEGGFDEESTAPRGKRGAVWFVDVGANANTLKINVEPNLPVQTTNWAYGPHFAIGARRAVSRYNDLGARIEIDRVHGHSLLGARFLDYRRRTRGPLAFSAFVGVARYDLTTPAYSMYWGVRVQWRGILPRWDIGADFRYAQNVARDHVLPSDAQGVRPETFYKIESVVLYLSRSF